MRTVTISSTTTTLPLLLLTIIMTKVKSTPDTNSLRKKNVALLIGRKDMLLYEGDLTFTHKLLGLVAIQVCADRTHQLLALLVTLSFGQTSTCIVSERLIHKQSHPVSEN